MSTKRRAYLTEMKTQLTLAVPALLAQIAMISMGFVDMVMTGRVGAVDMAAVALAGSLWVPLVLFGQGLLLAVTPCVAQLRGAGSMRSGEHMQGVGPGCSFRFRSSLSCIWYRSISPIWALRGLSGS